MRNSTQEVDVQFESPGTNRITAEKKQYDALREELKASRAREVLLLNEMRAQSQRQEILTQEFEHRLVNGLQLIASLLTMQSRAATSPEASAQLKIASHRVASLGRVHHRLHHLDHEEYVEFKQYLHRLCEDLAGLLFEGRAGPTVIAEGVRADIPSKFAIPLGFIVNELITNAAKYTRGDIIVRFEKAAAGHALSVLDDGPGLPPGFDPSKSRGLGMRIVLALVKQIGGELRVLPGDCGRGARFTVRFDSRSPEAGAAT